MNWIDPTFLSAMKEQEPVSRASFLSLVYNGDKESFQTVSPDEILVDEFGPDIYVELANQKLVPIAMVPAGIVLA